MRDHSDRTINISDYDYGLPDERIAKFPLEDRDSSKLLVYRGGVISQNRFSRLGDELPQGAMLVFNNTKVIRARLIMRKQSGARIEVFCLEPHSPADYERAFAARGECRWLCIIGNLKKWKEGALEIPFEYAGGECRLTARREGEQGKEHIVRFDWNAEITFGELLEHLGRIPIPPYLNRESQEIDNSRYQTVYSKFEGSVAAPTAGLHFTDSLMSELSGRDFTFGEVTLHVGAGTFLPVKDEDASRHDMHTEHFEVDLEMLERVSKAKRDGAKIIPVGTTSVRTLESLAVLGYRALSSGRVDEQRVVSQWEAYDIPAGLDGGELIDGLVEYMRRGGIDKLKAATQIMIAPVGFRYRITDGMITNFHQPKSTLLLLVSALVGDDWKRIYDYALNNDFRFLSYGDSSLLLRD